MHKVFFDRLADVVQTSDDREALCQMAAHAAKNHPVHLFSKHALKLAGLSPGAFYYRRYVLRQSLCLTYARIACKMTGYRFLDFLLEMLEASDTCMKALFEQSAAAGESDLWKPLRMPESACVGEIYTEELRMAYKAGDEKTSKEAVIFSKAGQLSSETLSASVLGSLKCALEPNSEANFILKLTIDTQALKGRNRPVLARILRNDQVHEVLLVFLAITFLSELGYYGLIGVLVVDVVYRLVREILWGARRMLFGRVKKQILCMLAGGQSLSEIMTSPSARLYKWLRVYGQKVYGGSMAEVYFVIALVAVFYHLYTGGRLS